MVGAVAHRAVDLIIGGMRKALGSLLALAVVAVSAQTPLRYRQLVPPPAPVPGAAVQLAPEFIGWLGEQAIKVRVNAEVERLRRDIETRLAQGARGVLVVIPYQESDRDVSGNRRRIIGRGFIGEAAGDPQTAWNRYTAVKRVEPNPGAGFTLNHAYVWVDRNQPPANPTDLRIIPTPK
jgi:hypothetical protein